MGDALRIREWDEDRLEADAAIATGKIYAMPDGKAGYFTGLNAAAIDDMTNWKRSGVVTVPKTTFVFLDGQEVWWDHSASKAHIKSANDRDFYLGTAVGDAASAATTMKVRLNDKPNYLIELNQDAFDTTIVKTVVGSTTVEVPHIRRFGGANSMLLGATAEAQKLDLLSKKAFALASNWIVEGEFNVVDDGSAGAIDFNIGLANDTHASDADAITESCFLHLDGNALDLFAESDDGTTEVAATDTTVNIVLGTPVHFVIDGRNPADIQIYVDGVLVLGSTVFRLDAAAGPLKLLAHLEKSADATVADYRINKLNVRLMQQDTPRV